MEHCMKDHSFRRQWSEQEMVMNCCGGMVPGTPDGMFEDLAGCLHCVQVVRLPIRSRTDDGATSNAICETVLAKLVKSIRWMQCTRTMPNDFVVFCWLLPHLRPRPLVVGLLRARSLVRHARRRGWPFSLKVAIATDTDDIFPEKFACNHTVFGKFTKADLVHFDHTEFDSDDDDEVTEWFDMFGLDEEDTDCVLLEESGTNGADENAQVEGAVEDGARDVEGEEEEPQSDLFIEVACIDVVVAVHFPRRLRAARHRSPTPELPPRGLPLLQWVPRPKVGLGGCQ